MQLSELVKPHVGSIVSDILIGTQSISIVLNAGTVIYAQDQQSCCEKRYFSVEKDELQRHIGSKLLRIEERGFVSQEETESECCTDKQFLDITTSLGTLTVTCYNEHSGYYGGFYLRWWKGEIN